MMSYRPFEAFCRGHFVDSSGNLQNSSSNSSEAKRRRADRHHNNMSHQLRTLQRDLSELYKKGREVREGEGKKKEVQDIFQKASKVRKHIVALKEELRKDR